MIIFILFILFFLPFVALGAPPQILLFDIQESGPFYQGQTITFKYKICDSDNDITEASLSYGDGIVDFLNFQNCFLSQQTHLFQTSGLFTVTLRVKDSSGNQITQTKNVEILINFPPEIKRFSFSSKSVFSTGGTIFFEIIACPPDKNDVLAGFIDFGDNTNLSFSPKCDLSNPTIIAHQYLGPGIYPIKLIVQDARGLRSEKSLKITIKPPSGVKVNFPPEIKRFSLSSKSQLFTGGIVYFEINICDPNDTNFIAASLDFGDGQVQNFTPTCDAVTPTIITHQYFSAKNYKAKLTAQDQFGLKTEKLLNFTIKSQNVVQPNFPPEIKRFNLSSRSQFFPGGIVYFEINVCDPNISDLVAANLDFGDGTNQSFTPSCLSSEPNILSHQYLLSNKYKATLTAKDQAGLQSQKSLYFTITIPGNRAPVANFSFTPSAPQAESTVYFIDKSTDNDKISSITSWQWDFGDGFTSTVQHPTHTYAKSGSYKVSLVVKDSGNLSSRVEKIINIKDVPNKPPIANFTFSPQYPKINQIIYFTDKSYDNDKERGGYIKSWYWSFGDGETSTLQHPTKIYNKSGNFKVQLTVTDNDGLSSSFSQNISIPLGGIITQFEKSGKVHELIDKNYIIKNGDLVKESSSGKIWHIINNKKHWIPNEEIFNLYGFSFDQIRLVSSSQLAKFKRAALLKNPVDGKIYYLHEDGRKRHLRTPLVFLSYGNKWEDVITVLPEELESYPDIMFIKLLGIPKIFMIENGVKRPIINPDSVAKSEAVFVNKIEFNAYLNGPPID